MEPEQRLMRAIVQQAFFDATAPRPPKLNYDEWRISRAQRDARVGHERSEVGYLAAWTWADCGSRAAIVRWGLNSKQAREWLTSNSNYFRKVCEFGGYDPD